VNSNQQALAAALDVLADLVAAKVVAQLRAGDQPDMVDQTKSPLGRRRHINAVRRLVAAGEQGAAQVGRRYLLSRDRLSAELASWGAVDKAAPVVDELAELRAKYSSRKGAA
jgi:hypothetical protein